MATSKASDYTLSTSKYLLASTIMALLLGSTSASRLDSVVNNLETLMSKTYSSKPIVKDELNTTWYINTTEEYNLTLYGNAFLRGMDADDILSPNTTACFNNWIWFYYHEIPIT
jgi:hypothetical protein